jgi:hypothetical protein
MTHLPGTAESCWIASAPDASYPVLVGWEGAQLGRAKWRLNTRPFLRSPIDCTLRKRAGPYSGFPA